MKIVETWAENDWGRQALRVEIDGKTMLEMVDGEPEDNCLARNFNLDIKELLEKAYYAGEAGSGFNYECVNVDWKRFFE